MTFGQLHIIYYIRARGKKGEGRGEKGNLAENRKAQRLGSTEKEKEGRKGGREEGRGEGRDEGRKRREAKDKREIFSYVVGISLLLIP